MSAHRHLSPRCAVIKRLHRLACSFLDVVFPWFTRSSSATTAIHSSFLHDLRQHIVQRCAGVGKSGSGRNRTGIFLIWLDRSQIFCLLLHPSGLQPHRIWRHWLLPVGSYGSLKNVWKCRIRRLHCCISREPFDLKSPNFTGPSTPTCATFALDVALLTTSSQKLKMPPQTVSGGISRERFKQGSLNYTRLSRTTGPTNLPDMTLLVTSSRL